MPHALSLLFLSRQNDGRLEAHHRTENNLADLVPSIILLGRKQ